MLFEHLSDINVVLAEPNRELRSKIITSLNTQGIKNITATGNINMFLQTLNNTEIDLIIADTTLPEGHLYDIIRDIRFIRKGKYAFPVIIAIVKNTNSDEIKKVIDAGVDEILMKPFEMSDLLLKLQQLSLKRRPFVVTSTYIGPDRRVIERVTNKPTITIPNPLSGNKMKKVQSKVIKEIYEQRLESDANFIKVAVQQLQDNISKDQIKHIILDLKNKADELLEISGETINYKHIKHHFLALSGLANDIIKEDFVLNDRDIYLLKSLSTVLLDMFVEDRCSVGFRKSETKA